MTDTGLQGSSSCLDLERTNLWQSGSLWLDISFIPFGAIEITAFRNCFATCQTWFETWSNRSSDHSSALPASQGVLAICRTFKSMKEKDAVSQPHCLASVRFETEWGMATSHCLLSVTLFQPEMYKIKRNERKEVPLTQVLFLLSTQGSL